MAIRAFKHIRAADLVHYERGSILLTTLEAMANREALKALHDPMEGQADMYADGPVELRAGDDGMIAGFIQAPPGYPVTFANLTIRQRAENAWIWCVTASTDAVIDGEGYDTVIEITDLFRLAKRLQIAAGGRLGPPIVKEVTYSARSMPLGQDNLPASAFIKGQGFQHERETRVLWPIQGEVPEAGMMSVQARSVVDLLRLKGRRLTALRQGE